MRMMGQAENEHHASIACSHNNGHSYLKAPIMPTCISQKEQYCLGTNFLFCKFKIKKMSLITVEDQEQQDCRTALGLAQP